MRRWREAVGKFRSLRLSSAAAIVFLSRRSSLCALARRRTHLGTRPPVHTSPGRWFIAALHATAALACVLALQGGAANASACTMTGTPGADLLYGTQGRDVICGLGGNDTIAGNGGNDVLIGGDGNDLISGGDGNDLIDGGPGNDKLEGTGGRDTILGGPGNDTIFAYDGQKDIVDGGPGLDRAWYDPTLDKLRGVER
jgi:RTX calcium-binding nonapeptide repeat (4 copies)